mgnify:CR=1 FL=1
MKSSLLATLLLCFFINICSEWYFVDYWYIMVILNINDWGVIMARTIDNKYENMFRWMSNKLRIQDRFNRNNQSHVKYPRGAIYACYFGENIGHEKSRLEARPCVIVSNNRINYRATNIVVIPLTKEIKYKDDKTKTELKYEWHYVLKKSKYNKLNYDSAVQCEDIRSVSKARMGRYICKIDVDDMDEIRKRIKKALQI